MEKYQKNQEDTQAIETDFVVGRNSVIETIKSGKSIDHILMSATEITGSLTKIVALAKENKIIIKNTTHKHLDEITGGLNHQGVAAQCSVAQYYSVDEILDYANEKGEAPFIIICDEIEDPHNLGAIIRTAEACGAHGVIIPKRRSASLNSTVYKTSAGAASVMRVSKVSNLVNTMKELKEKGVWFYCADMDGERYSKVNFSGAVGLVIGSEGFGVSRLVKQNCDFVVSMPMFGQINSLNASVAAGILMYEVVRNK